MTTETTAPDVTSGSAAPHPAPDATAEPTTFACYVVDADRRVLLTSVSDSPAGPAASRQEQWGTPLLGAVLPGERLSEAARRVAGDQLGLSVGAVRLVVPDARLDVVDPDPTGTPGDSAAVAAAEQACPLVVAVVDPASLDAVVATQAAWVAEPWVSLAHAGQSCRRDLVGWCARHVARLDALGPDPLHWPVADPEDLPSAHREDGTAGSVAW